MGKRSKKDPEVTPEVQEEPKVEDREEQGADAPAQSSSAKYRFKSGSKGQQHIAMNIVITLEMLNKDGFFDKLKKTDERLGSSFCDLVEVAE